MYHPKHNWTLTVREHLNKSLSEDGLIRQSLRSKPISFLSHPLPECSCRISSTDSRTPPIEGKDGRCLYGGEDKCPDWMRSGQETTTTTLDTTGVEGNDWSEPEYENDSNQESDNGSKSSLTLSIDQDDEWDPND